MSALRKEKPPAAAGQTTTARPAHNVSVDSTARRPPQSVAAAATEDTSDRVVDDTYDGEIVSSTVNPVARPGVSPDKSQTPEAQSTPGPQVESILNEATLRDFRARWDQVQTSFVDDPRHAVEQADALIGAVVKRIADQLAEDRTKLEEQWSQGQNVSTEELRQNFKRYRALFDRLIVTF